MQHALLDVIGDFYDCAIEPGRWPAALEKAAALLGSARAAISIQDGASNRTSFQSHWNIAPEFEASLQKNIEIDPIIPFIGKKEIDQPFSAFSALGEDSFANASARRQLRCADILRREGDRLAARDLQRSGDLRGAIAAAGGNPSGNSDLSRSLLLKGSAGRDLAVWIMPLGRDLCRDLDPVSAARVAVFTREIGEPASPFPAELFIRHFAITHAESRVLHLLLPSPLMSAAP